VIAGQHSLGKFTTAVKAEMAVAQKQGAIAERRHLAPPRLAPDPAPGGDNGMDVENAAPATAAVDAAVQADDLFTGGPGHLVETVEHRRLLPAQPRCRLAGVVEAQHLDPGGDPGGRYDVADAVVHGALSYANGGQRTAFQ